MQASVREMNLYGLQLEPPKSLKMPMQSRATMALSKFTKILQSIVLSKLTSPMKVSLGEDFLVSRAKISLPFTTGISSESFVE